MKYLSQGLSSIFHPLLLPLFGLYIFFQIPSESFGIVVQAPVKNYLYIFSLALTVVAPLLSVLIMYWNKIITSLTMPSREERLYPLGFVCIYYIISYYFLHENIDLLSRIPFLMPYIFGYTLTLVIAFIFTFYIKISLHAIAYFGVVGSLVAYMQVIPNPPLTFLFLFIILGGIICTARLYLKAHTLKEIIYGMVFGFGIEYFCMKFELFI